MIIRASHVYVVALSMLYLASTLQFGAMRSVPLFPLSGCFLLLVGLLAMTRGGVKIPNQKEFIFPVALFFACLIVSAPVSLAQESLEPLFTYIFYAATVSMCLILARSLTEQDMANLLNLQMLMFLGVATYGFLAYGFQLYRYAGIFDNPNSAGRFAFTQIAVCFSCMMLHKFTGVKANYKLVIISLILSFLILFASNSRTSIFCAAISFLVYAISFSGKIGFKIRVVTIRRYFFIFISLAAVLFSAYSLGMLDEIFNKFENTIQGGDITQQRSEFLIEGSKYINLYGYRDYYSVTGIESVHNNYLHMTLNYGAPIAVLFFTAYISIAIMSVYHGCHGNSLAWGAAIILLPAFAYFMAETGASIAILWLALMFHGFSMSKHIRRSS